MRVLVRLDNMVSEGKQDPTCVVSVSALNAPQHPGLDSEVIVEGRALAPQMLERFEMCAPCDLFFGHYM